MSELFFGELSLLFEIPVFLAQIQYSIFFIALSFIVFRVLVWWTHFVETYSFVLIVVFVVLFSLFSFLLLSEPALLS